MENKRLNTSRPHPLRMKTSSPIPPAHNEILPITSTLTSSGTTPPEPPSRSDSVTSTHTKSGPAMPRASSRNVSQGNITKDGFFEYCTDKVDYEMLKGRKLGAGRFSEVYLARSIVKAEVPLSVEPLTPPMTPTSPQSRGSWSDTPPALYAVKMAVDKGSAKALRGEARILSHLSMDSGSKQRIVSFHGLDPRYNSLIFTALPATLEDLIVRELESLDPANRAIRVASVLPHLARALTSGLAWMHSLQVVHADIKPANILLRADVPMSIPLPDGQRLLDMPFTPVFADFTSSFLTTDDPQTISSVGGGTYDYMAPEQLSVPFPIPNFKMDVYALAISILQMVTGSSPFKEARTNRHMKIEMIKEGRALAWAARDATGESRLNAVACEMLRRYFVDLRALLELGLRKNPAERLEAEQWSRLW